MKNETQFPPRIMAIIISTGRAGYAVLEGEGFLVDYGTLELRGLSMPGRIQKLIETIAWNLPDILVLEDLEVHRSMKGARTRRLVKQLQSEAGLRTIETSLISRKEVLAVFGLRNRDSKHLLAQQITNQFPELLRALPKKRKPWISEAFQLPMFEAAAMALAAHRTREF